MSALSIELRYHAGVRGLCSKLESDAERIAIVGPSGIGKSSLLRAVLGLDPSARGRITLRGHPLETVPVGSRRLGWVPQDALLLPHLDVRRNLAFAADVDVERIAALVGVAALLDRDVARLSGGERQRVALGRALAHRPKMLVLDEPLSALDRAARREIASAIEAWRAVHDFVVLLTSHDEMDVAALADEVYEMDVDGTLTRRSWPG